jgi:phosphotransferase system enzyme I (PtsI)
MKTKVRKDTMHRLVGKGISPGLAQGKAFVYRDMLQRDSELSVIDHTQIETEKIRIEDAIEDVRQSLTLDAQRIEERLGKKLADIFRAQEAILLDPAVVEELKRTLELERINAEQVVRTVFRLLARKFKDMSNATFRERSDDIDDLSRRLLLSLAGISAHSLETLPTNTVLVARHLLPSDTVFLSRLSTVAVLAEFAGPAAHAALLTRELGIPCVGGIANLLETVHTGDVVLVNGDQGTAVLNPNAHARQRFEKNLDKVQQRKETMAHVSRNERAVTLDGIEIAVMANVRSREDVELAIHCGADGIGLFRTEPFFLSAKHFPSDREFAEFLFDSLHMAQGKYVDVRLLDVGADKNPLYLHLPSEPDPFLGRRGVRVLLEYPELLEAQLRAVLEVSQHFSIGVLIPMVTTELDVSQVAQRFHQLAADMSIRTLPRLGAMIETPAAALSVSSLKKYVNFFSIGSNDLTQYTMAAGRENPLVMEYFIDDHPSILRLIELVIRESGDTPVSLCGELAGRIDIIPSLLRAGLRSFSVPATLVADVKHAIKQVNARQS